MNKPLLRKVRDMINRRPEQLIMRSFFAGCNESHGRPSHCGTAACIAGWALTLGGPKPKKTVLEAYISFGNDWAERIWNKARRRLGITQKQSSRLFSWHNWPEPFCSTFLSAGTQAKKAKIAVARINHFLKTGL